MPLSLPPVSRRTFLSSAAASSGLLLGRSASGAEQADDANHLVLLSDTHIAADPKARARGVTMHDHLSRVVEQIVSRKQMPAAALINGDCAYLSGQQKDYATLNPLLTRLRGAGLPVHLVLGNHDDRENFVAALEQAPADYAKPDFRHLTVIETPQANWLLLDSLDKVNVTPGLLGPKQLKWLATALDARREKPAIIVVHHDPYMREHGLQDTEKLFEVLEPRRQVKVVAYGHRHRWFHEKRDGIHLVNLPAVAYTFAEKEPSGYVDAHVKESSMLLRLTTLDPKHPAAGQEVTLAWRTG